MVLWGIFAPPASRRQAGLLARRGIRKSTPKTLHHHPVIWVKYPDQAPVQEAVELQILKLFGLTHLPLIGKKPQQINPRARLPFWWVDARTGNI
jgi:hypothetical protein